MEYDIIIIGAGASGMLAGISAAENGSSVLILEKMSREGRKMLISGKGRCNITNTAYQSEYFKKIFPDGKFLKPAFSEFFSNDIIRLLEEHNLKIKEERGGRIFPESDNAADVVNTLFKILKKKNVHIKKNARVKEIIVRNGTVSGVKLFNNDELSCNKIIICTGGKSYPATGSSGDGYILAKNVGHSIISVRPALVPIETTGNTAKKLQGLSLKNINVSVWIEGKKNKEAFGEMLFAHFGLTGPVILTLSRTVVDALIEKKDVEIRIDLKPALDDQKLDARLQRELNNNGKKRIKNIMRNILPSKLIPVVLEFSQIDPEKECHQITSKERKGLKTNLKNLKFNISGYRSFKEAIVSAGGIDTNEIDSKTMMSKLVKNLYFAGEIIDLDAETGGYNFQVAFSTGWLAGKSAALTGQ